MAMEIKQSLRMSQQLVVTPQLQQAIRLLQLSRLELETLVQKELTENPCLEEEEEESETVKLEAKEGEVSNGEVHEQAKELDQGHEHAVEEVGLKEKDPQEPANFDWENYINSTDSPSGAYERNVSNADDRPSFENNLKKMESLQEHLFWQLGLAVNFDEEEMPIAEEVIGNINEDGYLQTTVEEIAQVLDSSVEKIEGVLKKVQAFDPIGVAARDLQECLRLQIKNLEGEDGIWIGKMVEQHLKNLELHDYKQIAKDLGLTVEKVLELEKMMHQVLDPKPGRAYSTEEPQYITPDVFVTKRKNEYVVTLNEDGMPRLAISPLYRRAIMAGETVGVQAKEYIQDKLRQALWLIKSIHQRQRTLYRVTQSIVKFQRDFFDKGTVSLKPMVLKDVAEDINMHESTVSRVTTNKYVHTPRGIFELKYFFNSSLGAKEGNDGIASEVVKEHLQNLLATESSAKPLSDQEISKILKEKHSVDIARRTVAKYREMLGILPSSRRRRRI